jgi:hypothetical protein
MSLEFIRRPNVEELLKGLRASQAQGVTRVQLDEQIHDVESQLRNWSSSPNYSGLLEVAIFQKDPKKVRNIADELLKHHAFLDATKAFMFLKDDDGVQRTINEAERFSIKPDGRRNSLYLGSACLLDYFNERAAKGFREHYIKWAGSKSLEKFNPPINEPTLLNMAHELSANYDLGVAVAMGGMPMGYLFDMMGLDVRVVEYHRQSGQNGLKYVDAVGPDDVRGRRVAVFDKDVRTGETTTQVLEELQAMEPASVDLLVKFPPVEGGPPISTVLEAVPKGYRGVISPDDVSYGRFVAAVDKLNKRIEKN